MDCITWKDNKISKLVLGTAQLGMDYGIANLDGKPNEETAHEIIETALVGGINCFDTAQVYGDSEIVLGKALKEFGALPEIYIVSKLSPVLNPSDPDSVSRSIELSCQNLGIGQLWCLMLHCADWLDIWDKGLGQTLKDACRQGRIKHLGVSVYKVDEARRALEHPDIQVVQIPCNAWDQIMLTDGIFELAREKDKLCFVRSIYLQGLAVLSPEQVAEKLPRAKDASLRWHKLAAELDMKPETLAMRFGLSLNGPLVVGAETPQQVEQNIRFCEQPPLESDIVEEIRKRMKPLLRNEIVDPSQWNN